MRDAEIIDERSENMIAYEHQVAKRSDLQFMPVIGLQNEGMEAGMLLHEVIEYNAAELPDTVAFVSEHKKLTWLEIDEFSERIADYLSDRGVARGDRVGVLSRNCVELMAIFIAASKLGAIYAPLNYRLSSSELARVINDCDPIILFVHEELSREAAGSTVIEPSSTTVVEFGHTHNDNLLSELCDGFSRRERTERAHEDDPLWICYTGGSTGMPKGVVLSHRNMSATAQNFVSVNHIVPTDVYLLAGPMYHVVLAVSIGYWWAGARTVIMNFEPAKALSMMEREGVTRMVATGTIFKMLVDEMDTRPRQGLRLRNIDFGGAPIPVELALRAAKLFNCTVGQIYGQSENSVMCTYLPPEDYLAAIADPDSEVAAARLRSVGKAAPGLHVRVMNAQRRLLPPGKDVGEVVVKGDTVMLGYWRQEELTASTLVDGWLRTGDLGYMEADGYIYLVDRLKDVIISGGENVYSSEVELALAAHPGIEEAVVVGKPDSHWGETVHAIIVPVAGYSFTPEELIHFCRGEIAGYKVPRTFDFRNELPRLPTGKIAKHELRFSPDLTKHAREQ